MDDTAGTAPPQVPNCLKLVNTLKGHARAVASVRFSPTGGDVLATASADSTAAIWDASSGSQLCSLRGHDRGVSDAAWSPDGRYVCTVSDDLSAKLWDAGTGTCLRTLTGHSNYVCCADFDPHGHLLVRWALEGAAFSRRLASSGKGAHNLRGRREMVLPFQRQQPPQPRCPALPCAMPPRLFSSQNPHSPLPPPPSPPPMPPPPPSLSAGDRVLRRDRARVGRARRALPARDPRAFRPHHRRALQPRRHATGVQLLRRPHPAVGHAQRPLPQDAPRPGQPAARVRALCAQR